MTIIQVLRLIIPLPGMVGRDHEAQKQRVRVDALYVDFEKSVELKEAAHSELMESVM